MQCMWKGCLQIPSTWYDVQLAKVAGHGSSYQWTFVSGHLAVDAASFERGTADAAVVAVAVLPPPLTRYLKQYKCLRKRNEAAYIKALDLHLEAGLRRQLQRRRLFELFQGLEYSGVRGWRSITLPVGRIPTRHAHDGQVEPLVEDLPDVRRRSDIERAEHVLVVRLPLKSYH